MQEKIIPEVIIAVGEKKIFETAKGNLNFEIKAVTVRPDGSQIVLGQSVGGVISGT